jgi:hypothetical protein
VRIAIVPGREVEGVRSLGAEEGAQLPMPGKDGFTELGNIIAAGGSRADCRSDKNVHGADRGLEVSPGLRQNEAFGRVMAAGMRFELAVAVSDS